MPHLLWKRRLPDLFAQAARRAREAGFDGVELHYAHAYTMASFLSRLNDRADGYGGTRGNRVRLPLEVFRRVREVAGGDFPIGCRFLADAALLEQAKAEQNTVLNAERAQELGLVTFALDDIDWDDEVRVFLEERASFSPDALTGLEANLRFAGPETMESKIFARLTAWQNWIFQRPNAVGEDGALRRYGTGQKPVFDTRRV